MAYDGDFYHAYRQYLQEPGVRQVHDGVLKLARTNPHLARVIDLGCGHVNEFYRYGRPRPQMYVGVDVNAGTRQSKTRKLLVGDYRQLDTIKREIRTQALTAFVSLFSVEITATHQTNYELYNRLFAETNLQAGLVSGFYYAANKHANPIGETGGIQSYQTLECLEDVYSQHFHETRIVCACPSTMFGPDVIEVWKLFERRRQA